jgi:tetratricopeptide (TPR) repeat protein
VVNLLLLAGCGTALWRLGRRGGMSPGAALLAGALLVVHPAMVEAVAWINQSKTLLALLFALLALERWLAHLDGPSSARLGAALAFGTLAVLAKSAVVLLPGVFALAWVTHGRGAPRDGWAVVLLALLSGYALLMNVQAQALGGGVSSWFGGSPEATARILPSVVWRYLRMAVLPYDPVFYVHPLPIDSWIDTRVCLPTVAIAMAGALAIRAIRRDRRVGLAVGWIAAMLLPVLQLVPMPVVYADRYLAMALPGLLVLGAAWGADLPPLRRRTGLAWATASVLVLALGLRSAWQARLWARPEALFEQTVAAYPASRFGWTGLGGEQHQRGALDLAANAYGRALAIEPHDGHARYLLARVRLQQGANPAALADLEQALRDAPGHPDAAWMRAQVATLRERGVAPVDDAR